MTPTRPAASAAPGWPVSSNWRRKPGFNDGDSRARELRDLWKQVPSALKQDPAMVARYAGFLAQLGEGSRALSLVKEQLERDWDDRLPPVLEAIDDVSPDELLQNLEKWLVDRPGNAAVLGHRRAGGAQGAAVG